MNQTLRSFISGELDPALHQRVDLAKFSTGLKTCLNFFMRPQGGLYNRPGTRYIGPVSDSATRHRLIPFAFNTEQTYILEFGPLTMRVIKDGGYVLDQYGDPYEMVTPYTESDLFDTTDNVYSLDFTQTADVMTITHRNHPVKELARLAHNNWTLTTVNFASTMTPPQFTEGASVAVDTVSIGGYATVTTTTQHGFVNDNVITLRNVINVPSVNNVAFRIYDVTLYTFRLKDVATGAAIDTTWTGGETSGWSGTASRAALSPTGSGAGSYNKTYRYVVTVTDADGNESLPSNEADITTKSLSTTAGIILTWGHVAGAAYYTVYKDSADGSGVYGFIGEATTNSYTDFNIAGDTSRTPPEENLPISEAGKYPGVVGYYQQRKIFANTIDTPQQLFATQVGIYNSMRSSTPAKDDDALTYAVSSRQVNEIRHIVDLEDLMLLTSSAVFRVTEGQDFVLTPSTIGAKVQSYNGASKVRPATVDDSVIFVQDQGSRVRNLNYSVDAGKYTGSDLSIMSEHLFERRTIVEMAYASSPYGILWCVMSDGTLCAMTYQKEHQVWGWHRHETDGHFESVATIREGNRDAVYFIVRRTVDGITVRYVERLEARVSDDVTQAYFVDCGLSYSGEATTTFGGLEHLEGREVVALADGNVVKGLTVELGGVTLPVAASVVHIGLPYVSEAETLGIDSAETTIQGRVKNIAAVSLRVLSSRGGWVGPNADEMTEIKPRYDSDGYGAIALKTFEERVAIMPGWNSDGRVVVRQIDPLPLAITAITPEFDIGG